MRQGRASVTRLIKTARGQLDGILRMIDEERYCIDVADQLLATQAMLRRACRDILTNHMETCVTEAFEQGGGQEKIDELIRVMEQMAK